MQHKENAQTEPASETAQIHEAAAHGTSGASGTLPHLAEIQRSFGDHDVSHIKAHTDDRATAAARSMGAEAFATGEHVAFAGSPSLHTAAHEAAHVVQQRAGVQLKGGVGEVRDQYEQHADAVADRVVQGKSSAALLDEFVGGTKGQGAVQLKGQTPPAGSGYQDGENSYAAVQNLFKGGAKPTAETLINTIYRCTLAQRTALRNDATFLGKVVKAGYSGSDLLRVLEKLILTPVKMIETYAIQAKFSDASELRRIIADANVAQRVALIKNQKVCEKLHDVFADITPANLFGTDVTVGQKAQIEALPWYSKWAAPKAGDKKPTDVDTEKGLSELVTDREARAKSPVWSFMAHLLGMASEPTVKWADLLRHLPRGKALNTTQRAALDKCALELTDEMTVDELLQLFEVRFGCSLVDATTLGEKHKDYDRVHIKHLWDQLQRLPPEHVTQQLIRRIGVYDAGGGSGGAYNDLGTSHGTITLGDADVDGTKGGADWAYFEATTRHEVGHAVDVQVGGYERFTSKCKAQWRRYQTADAFVAEFIRVTGGDAKLKAAAQQFLDGTLSKTQWNKAVDAQKSLKAPKGNVKFALANLSADYTTLVNNPTAEVNGRKFCVRWGGEYMSWAVAGEDTAGISDYAYNSWAEFFAETYSKWFDGKPPNYDYSKKLPAWIESAGFGRVVGHEDPAKAAKKGSGSTPKGK
ncbi:MAG TPA: DUF4157 domain-containing protein [Polyangia bacterium]|nr:DUF4157 domain-containing protein [Polyangia bacterium]